MALSLSKMFKLFNFRTGVFWKTVQPTSKKLFYHTLTLEGGGRGLMSAILHITTVLPENPCYFEVTVYYRGSKDLLLAMSKSNQHFSLMPFFLNP